MMIIVYFSTAIKGSSLTLYFTFRRVLSIHTNPYQALIKNVVVSFLVVLKMPFFNENLYYTACDSGGIQIKNIVVSFLVVLKMPFSIEIFIAQLTMLDAFT